MSGKVRLGRHAGSLYLAIACLIAASILIVRLRRPPDIVLNLAAGYGKDDATTVPAAEGVEEPPANSGDAEPLQKGIPASEGRAAGVDGEEAPGQGIGDGASTILVHVAGQVARPGLYELPEGSRVMHALEAAGGLAEGADGDFVNIALPIRDGQQVYIPKAIQAPVARGVAESGIAGKVDDAAGKADESEAAAMVPVPVPEGRVDVFAAAPEQADDYNTSTAPPEKVNINTAGQEALETLPGIGPALARKVIEHREANGPFPDIEGLMDVSGIGPAKFEAMKEMVTIR